MGARTVIHLLRHGQVDNPDGILYGRAPGFHLSARGHEMARMVADYLADNDITVIVSSPLERAQETAAPLVELTGVPLRLDDRLIEAENSFAGAPFDNTTMLQPASWLKVLNPFRPSWGEPYAQIAARMLAVIAAARDAARGHEAVLVSHQLPVWTARSAIEGRRLWHDPRSRECALASLTSIEYDGDDVVCLSYCEPARSLLAEDTLVAGS